jgi:hypothetical protein
MITDADVAEFQELYEKRFGAVIDRDEAYKKLTLLVRQIEIIYQPITRSQYEEYVNEHGDDNGETEQKSQQDS